MCAVLYDAKAMGTFSSIRQKTQSSSKMQTLEEGGFSNAIARKQSVVPVEDSPNLTLVLLKRLDRDAYSY